MSTLALTLYDALITANVPKQTAQNVVDALKSEINQAVENEVRNRQMAAKADIESLNLKIDNVHKELKTESNDLKIAIAELKAEMLKWYLTSSMALAGVVIAAIKLL